MGYIAVLVVMLVVVLVVEVVVVGGKKVLVGRSLSCLYNAQTSDLSCSAWLELLIK